MSTSYKLGHCRHTVRRTKWGGCPPKTENQTRKMGRRHVRCGQRS